MAMLTKNLFALVKLLFSSTCQLYDNFSRVHQLHVLYQGHSGSVDNKHKVDSKRNFKELFPIVLFHAIKVEEFNRDTHPELTIHVPEFA